MTPKQLRRKSGSLLLVDMNWKNDLDQEIERHYSFIDVRAPERFYDGRIKSFSSFTRGLDDRTGLFKVSDSSMVLANHDKAISKLLANYFLKDQICSIYHVWHDEPDASRSHVIDFIVEDYFLEGVDFNIKLKDITQTYFKRKLPEETCTIADWPNIHPDYIGRFKPEILGCAQKTTGENKGAVEAIYVDTAGPPPRPYRYLISRYISHFVTTVYSNSVPLLSADWTFSPGPPSIISLSNNQYDNIITVDCHGYWNGISPPEWNDPVDGYIRNPAYILLYFIAYLLNVPMTLIDTASFDAMAQSFIDRGEQKAGYLILQNNRDCIEYMREMLFSYGMKCYIAKGGKIAVGRKDIANYATNVHIFDQIDLMEPARRNFNLARAINVAGGRWGFIPWCNDWIGSTEREKTNPWVRQEDDILKEREPERRIKAI